MKVDKHDLYQSSEELKNIEEDLKRVLNSINGQVKENNVKQRSQMTQKQGFLRGLSNEFGKTYSQTTTSLIKAYKDL